MGLSTSWWQRFPAAANRYQSESYFSYLAIIDANEDVKITRLSFDVIRIILAILI